MGDQATMEVRGHRIGRGEERWIWRLWRQGGTEAMEDKSMMVNALVGNEPKAAARGNRTRNTTARGAMEIHIYK